MRGGYGFVLASFLGAGCIDLGRTVDTEGQLSASIASRAGGSALLHEDVVRGPARFRRLSLTTTMCVVRFVRTDAGGLRRGELFLRLVTPFGVPTGANFNGDLTPATATYVETGAAGDRSIFTVSGKTRLELVAGPTTSFRLALQLDLRGSAPGGARVLTLRGVAFSSGSPRITADFGVGFWGEAFDAAFVVEHPTLDFRGFAELPSGEGAWVVATSEAPPGFGHFDFGDAGQINGPDYHDDPGFDPNFDPNFNPGSSSTSSDFTPSPGVPSYDDDADGGCQGDKSTQDSSECAGARGGVRGFAYGATLLALGLVRLVRRRRRR